MCDDDDEEVIAEGGDLYQHLIANGLHDFEVHNKSPWQTELSLHIKKVESKYKSMSFLNMFIPYKKCNMSLVKEIRDCHLLLEEDALYLESLNMIDIEEPTNIMQTASICAAIAWPMMLLCHVSCKKLLTMTLVGLGFLSTRQMIGIIRQRLDHKMMCTLVNALKGFSAICRKCQSLAQEWEVIAGNMNILKDTTLFHAKMCGIDELKEDLVQFLRLCIINLTESSRDIVSISTGNDLHPLCMEVMRSEVMIENDNSISKAKKLHYLFVLVQSDFLKNLAVSFIPCTKSISNMAACAATVKSCISYTTQYVQECTGILTQKYEILKNYTPQAKMPESVYKYYSRSSTFGDVRQTVNNITVCLEALTLQSLLVQRALERYDDPMINDISKNISDMEKVCGGTEDALLALQTDLHATQCSVELAVKQLTRLRKSDQEKRHQKRTECVENGNMGHSQPETQPRQVRNLDDLPDHIRDEVFELCENVSDDELDQSNSNDTNLQEIIQKRAEQRVAGKLMKELKIALMSKRAEMRAREEIARAANHTLSRQISTQTYNQKETPSEMIASIVETYNEEMEIKNISPISQCDLEISDKMAKPEVRVFKKLLSETDENEGSSSTTITSESILAQTGSLFRDIGRKNLQNEMMQSISSDIDLDNTSSQILEVLHSDTLCRDSSLESLYLDHDYSDLSLLKEDLRSETDDQDKEDSEYELNFRLNKNGEDRCGYVDLKTLSNPNISNMCLSEGCSSSDRKSETESVKSEIRNNIEMPISNGDYLLNNLPKRAKPPSRRPSGKSRYKYEPESGDKEIQPLIRGFKLPNEAVTKAREMNLIGTEECFGNTD